ncbi:MAG: ABC transporter permease [bacterium]|nr:ABC transporter permease [bacterium]
MSRFISHYGMLGVLLLLCILFSVLTLSEQQPSGENAARLLARELSRQATPEQGVLILAGSSSEDLLFTSRLSAELASQKFSRIKSLNGEPLKLRSELECLVDSGEGFSWFVTTPNFAPTVESIKNQLPAFASLPVLLPPTFRWPTFLLADNLRNVANQITVIAIIAIGMTMIIITAGIDLSVGSLLALSAVVTAWLISALGGESASSGVMVLGSMGGILLCGLVGLFSGLMITRFRIPPFIATLAMMQVAAGFGYIISQGKPIYQLPDGFIGLGRGADPLLGIPYAVILMVLLYLIAHIMMARTTLGRYIYAIGGNAEAARLAGIRVKRVLLFVYTLCGMLAGLGGVIMASQLKSGAPTYGLSYELYVIAAVVVGGTSLSGGEGRIFGTLIGAFIIGVIQNGMNLTNVESYTQKVVLGLVILGAVLLDQLKQQGMKLRGK